jgi:hypothetical protein
MSQAYLQAAYPCRADHMMARAIARWRIDGVLYPPADARSLLAYAQRLLRIASQDQRIELFPLGLEALALIGSSEVVAENELEALLADYRRAASAAGVEL